ncbi:MAG: hypothetical protein ACTSUE_16725 [Promethearchaeota archaeon]
MTKKKCSWDMEEEDHMSLVVQRMMLEQILNPIFTPRRKYRRTLKGEERTKMSALEFFEERISFILFAVSYSLNAKANEYDAEKMMYTTLIRRFINKDRALYDMNEKTPLDILAYSKKAVERHILDEKNAFRKTVSQMKLSTIFQGLKTYYRNVVKRENTAQTLEVMFNRFQKGQNLNELLIQFDVLWLIMTTDPSMKGVENKDAVLKYNEGDKGVKIPRYVINQWKNVKSKHFSRDGTLSITQFLHGSKPFDEKIIKSTLIALFDFYRHNTHKITIRQDILSYDLIKGLGAFAFYDSHLPEAVMVHTRTRIKADTGTIIYPWEEKEVIVFKRNEYTQWKILFEQVKFVNTTFDMISIGNDRKREITWIRNWIRRGNRFLEKDETLDSEFLLELHAFVNKYGPFDVSQSFETMINVRKEDGDRKKTLLEMKIRKSSFFNRLAPNKSPIIGGKGVKPESFFLQESVIRVFKKQIESSLDDLDEKRFFLRFFAWYMIQFVRSNESYVLMIMEHYLTTINIAYGFHLEPFFSLFRCHHDFYEQPVSIMRFSVNISEKIYRLKEENIDKDVLHVLGQMEKWIGKNSTTTHLIVAIEHGMEQLFEGNDDPQFRSPLQRSRSESLGQSIWSF